MGVSFAFCCILYKFIVFIILKHSHVWWKLKKVDTHVDIHLFLTVDVQLLVWIYRHQQCANVSLKE